MGIDDFIDGIGDVLDGDQLVGTGDIRSRQTPTPSPKDTRRIAHLEKSLAKSLTICEALWEIIRDEKGYTDAVIQAKVKQIQQRHGDGKRKPLKCTQCGRTVAAHHKACIYCGNANEKSLFAM